jgi:peroxiredoxin
MALVLGLVLAIGCETKQRAAPSPRELVGDEYAAPAGDGRELIGTSPPEWTLSDWINSEPLTLASLRGKVVLVRWWTAPQCPYCQASAPALNEFWEKYRKQGLMIVGLYHHKSSEPLTRAHVADQMRQYKFHFPVATDADWQTLNRWWLNADARRWTSVTFLLDRAGRIQHIHPGGAFFKGEPSYDALQERIETLLHQP